MADIDPEDRLRRVRWHMANAESGLDHATTALTRVRELSSEWREEIESDVAVLRSKLDVLRTMMNGR
jgi:hypothetical protein